MLSELRIQNFAIIDRLDLRFGPGLTILTGETGAGKSIILDAVVMLIGGKAALLATIDQPSTLHFASSRDATSASFGSSAAQRFASFTSRATTSTTGAWVA
mgnify:CR=1 FL=1